MPQGVIHAPIVTRIAEELYALMKSDAALRKLQGANAPQASYFDRTSITGATVYKIVQATAGAEVFSSLVVTLDTASGLGFYRIDGIDASPTVGVEIPAGGGMLMINGQDNIKNFSMCAQALATLTFARYLYK